jgi:hypothetical protein
LTAQLAVFFAPQLSVRSVIRERDGPFEGEIGRAHWYARDAAAAP